MTDKRPVNLDIGSIHFPVMAVVSILHRITGLVLIAAFAAFLYLLDVSLSSPEGFARAAAALQSTPCKIGVWAVLAMMAYHTVAGIKHLIMDAGIGESLEGGRLGSQLTLIIAALSIAAAGWWVYSW